MDAFEHFKIDKKSDIPIWVQLKQRLAYLIVSGAYKQGEQLPTVRELAIRLDINYHTVNKVYHDLENDGLIEIQVGRGSHAADLSKSRFHAIENERRLIAAESANKLLSLGMIPDEAVQSIADCLNVSIQIVSTHKDDPSEQQGKRHVG